MKHFKSIAPVKEKPYKHQNESIVCIQCGERIDMQKDFFQLNMFWKIKKKPDIKNFCSLTCVRDWCKD